jgi:hypothetical protein
MQEFSIDYVTKAIELLSSKAKAVDSTQAEL